MRKNFIILSLFLSFFSFAQSNFSNGFSDGYKKGYCQNQGIGCMSPIPPIPPIPNTNENLNSYQDGYNRGFESGLNEQKSSANSSSRQNYQTADAKFVDFVNSANTGGDELLSRIRTLSDLLTKAYESFQNNDNEIALELCNKAISLQPDYALAYYLRSNIYKDMGQIPDAWEDAKKAKNLYSNSNAPYNDLPKYKLATQKYYDYFYKELTQGNQQNSTTSANNEEIKNKVKVFFESVTSLYKNDKYDEAILLIDREINNVPKDFKKVWEGIYLIRGHCNYVQKKYFEAISDYTLSLDNSTKENPNTIFYRALCKSEIRNDNGAISDYEKLIKLGIPEKGSIYDLATVYNNKAYALTKSQKFNEALPFVKKALELNKSYSYIWDTKGEIEYNLGNYNQCILDMSEAIKIEKKANSLYFRGLSYFELGKKELGCKDLTSSGEMGKKDAYYEINKYCK